MKTKTFTKWEEAVLWLKMQPGQEELVRDCYYDDPALASAQRFHGSAEWRAVQGLIGPGSGKKALDVGAGRGMSSYALARDGWRVTALEPDPSTVVGAGAIRAIAGESGLGIEVVESWGETLPFGDGTFDLVYGRQVLHHASDLKKFCAEASRVLKPGGVFLAVREHVLSRHEDLQDFLERHPLQHLYGGENAFLLEEYREALVSGGFRVRRIWGPQQSDINLFPGSMAALEEHYRKKYGFRIPPALMKVITWRLVRRDHTPGRLYTFLCRKAG